MPPVSWLPEGLQDNPVIVWPILIAGAGYVASLLWRYVLQPLWRAAVIGKTLGDIALDFRPNGKPSLRQEIDTLKENQRDTCRGLKALSDQIAVLADAVADVRPGGRRKYDPPSP